MLLRSLCIAAALFTFAPGARASDLDAVQKQLEDSRRQESERANAVKALKKDLEGTRKELVALATAVRKSEKELMALDERAAALAGEQQQIRVRLESDFGSISNLVLAMHRLRRTPPEALIIRPGAPLETAQTAMLLESVLPSISRRAEALTADLERLRRIGEELEKDRVTALAARTELNEKRKTMAVLLKDREKLYSAAENGRAEAAEEVQRLAAEAKSLRDLLNKLEKEQEKQSAEHKGPRRRAPTPDAQLPGLGKAQIPAEGIITVSYGEKDGIGAKSEGLTIEASANAIVVSPMGGVVRFSGPFKNYGNMIIIEHKDDYHSLIAGLDDVDVSEGDKLEAGEPVGSLPASSSRGGKPALYYELRQKGRPVDPSHTFSGLRT